MSRLNENQRRRILSVFRHVGRLLDEAERLAAPPSPGAGRVPQDLSPRQARRLRSQLATVRERMEAALERLGLDPPEQGGSTRGQIDAALRFARNALADLRPRKLRGYGTLEAGVAEEIEVVVGELEELLEQAAGELRRANGA